MSYIEQMQRTAMLDPRTGSMSSNENQQSTHEKIQTILEIVQQQKEHTNRILKLNQNKIYSLEKEMSELRQELKQATGQLEKINDKEIVRRSREALFNRQEKAPADKPIDRNGVCPKDVQIENIFNFSGRKF